MKTMSMVTLMAFMLAIIPRVGYAQDAEYYDIKKDESAPYAGVLFNPQAYARISVDLKYCEEEKEIEIKFAVDKIKAELQLKIDLLESDAKYWKDRYEISEKYSKITEDRLIKELKKSNNPTKEAFLVLLGVILGGGLVFLGGAVQAEMSKGN